VKAWPLSQPLYRAVRHCCLLPSGPPLQFNVIQNLVSHPTARLEGVNENDIGNGNAATRGGPSETINRSVHLSGTIGRMALGMTPGDNDGARCCSGEVSGRLVVESHAGVYDAATGCTDFPQLTSKPIVANTLTDSWYNDLVNLLQSLSSQAQGNDTSACTANGSTPPQLVLVRAVSATLQQLKAVATVRQHAPDIAEPN
jgi:hypothetical protein